MSFPEEPFDLPLSEGGGYYPAIIGQKLNGDKFEIVRKLGYGPRSSTWLVFRPRDPVYFAVKIFTIAASDRAKTVELPIVKAVDKLDSNLGLPIFQGSFWEDSGAGSHLCFVLNPLSTSVQALQLGANHHRFPVHVVQRIVGTVARALKGLHDAGIMHGAIKGDNIFFLTPVQFLHSEPTPTTVKVKKYTTVRSQPLNHRFKWNDKSKIVADWPIGFDNFGHGGLPTGKKYDYLSAPETLLQRASCSPQTDIWMLGYMTFYLLTGDVPFYSSGNVSKRIATLCAALEDELPEEWLSDNKMKDFNPDAHGLVTSINVGLANTLQEDEIAAAAAFIKGCLRLDPQKRFSAEDCVGSAKQEIPTHVKRELDVFWYETRGLCKT
ncbi:kinase-like domain-containing protein [Gymnopilus junonius]|uniref:Kinase-like domain-containing protein n=1 Tax=Gymnopilus junonius TaxID=109634 RepID=A0A9P5NMD6_GYMJU|nr:kinase-like domain-containing protein [Gymnopilus junonius]